MVYSLRLLMENDMGSGPRAFSSFRCCLIIITYITFVTNSSFLTSLQAANAHIKKVDSQLDVSVKGHWYLSIDYTHPRKISSQILDANVSEYTAGGNNAFFVVRLR